MAPNNTRTTSSTVAPGGFAYWFLLALGFSTLTPAILLPEWREYQAIRLAEQVEQERADAMERLVDRKERALERLQSDPTVTARLAQRDLRYHRKDQLRLAVASDAAPQGEVFFDMPDVLPAVEPQEPIVVDPVTPPVWLKRWLEFLPPFDYDRVFCNQKLRPIIMTMSVALIGLAFVLYGRRAPTAAGRAHP